MYKEVDLGEGNKLIFFREINFWEDVLSKKIEGTKKIDIVTYNFNFDDKESKSFYNKLISLAEKGVNIRLMYHPAVSKDAELDDVFASEILCVRIPFNHSKIFWSEKFVYIGSANFSLGSNKNYESGFISTNFEVIDAIYQEILCNEIWKNPEYEIWTSPCFWDPLSLVREAIINIDAFRNTVEIGNYEHEGIMILFTELTSVLRMLEQKNVGITVGCLLANCEELESFYYATESAVSEYVKENCMTIRDIVENVKNGFLEVEKELQELYEKFGKYNFISEL